jgi:PHP family Zn ribbon phosphoesterase
MAKYSKKAQEKIAEVMHEFKHGKLKSGKGGEGGVVKSREQAIAIGISEAREAGLKVPKE